MDAEDARLLTLPRLCITIHDYTLVAGVLLFYYFVRRIS